MSRDMIPIYGGKLKANRIGSFTRGGLNFDIIRPGYDSQGRRRQTWTQILFEGIPIYEAKLQAELDAVLNRFNADWDKHIGDDIDLMQQALKRCQGERLSKFMDGKTEVEPAPALNVDGRDDGNSYPS